MSFHNLDTAVREYLNSICPPGTKPKKPYRENILEHVEAIILQFAVIRKRGNRCQAAKELRINRNTLRRRLIKYNLDNTVKEIIDRTG